MLLDAPVPDPGPAGPYGTMAWLRATVSRFANGETHVRRRALVEALLADLDPAELRHAAAAMTHDAATTPPCAAARAETKLGRAVADEPWSGAAGTPHRGAAHDERQLRRAVSDEVDVRASRTAIDPPYVPVAALAAGLGVGSRDLGAAVAATRVVAAAYHPHTDADGADAALSTLLSLLPGGAPEAVAARVAVLVQACEATAGLVQGKTVPVPATRRIGPNGELVLVDLTDHPFGAGRRRCPGEAHARALVDGVLGR